MKKCFTFILTLLIFASFNCLAQEFKFDMDYETTVFEAVDTMPEFIWGEDSLQKFIEAKQEPVYTKEGKKVTGMVAVSFIVTRYGVVQKPEIVKSQDERLNRAALATVAQLRDYRPGRKFGEAVNTKVTAVVHFR